MQNLKVYLAKSNLASGLDFEYVKSNLLRIPGIEIIEYGQGVEPFECACLVYIHDDVKFVQEDSSISINKNVFDAVVNFTANAEETAVNSVFIYLGKSHSSPRDVEETTPFMVPSSGISANLLDENVTWDNTGRMFIDVPEGFSLLESVSIALDISNENAWEKYTRHDHPKPQYSMPPIPDLSSRTSRGSKRHTVIIVGGDSKLETIRAAYKKAISSTKVKPVLTPYIYDEETEEEDVDSPTPCYNSITADSLITSRKPRRRR